MIGRFARNVFTAEVIGLLLILIALQSLTFGIAGSLQNTDGSYFSQVGIVAALLALGLSKSRWNGIQASFLFVALGLIGVWILGARLPSPLLGLGKAFFSLMPQIIPAFRTHIPLDTTDIVQAWVPIAEASTALWVRVFAWLASLHQKTTVNDALVRSLVWILIVWLVAACMGWFAGKRNGLAALLPSIVLLALVTSYSERRVETLWLIVFVLLLLLGVWNYKNHTQQWEIRKVDYSDSISYDVGQAVILLALLIGGNRFHYPVNFMARDQGLSARTKSTHQE